MRKILITLALILAVLPAACAQVLITEVMYDPETSESDTEFIELYNAGEETQDIGGWSINTTSQQAVIPPGTTIRPGSYFLIADIDNSGIWPSDWPVPDFEDEITLPNTNSGVVLLDAEHNMIDAVGWGNPSAPLYLGTPASHVPEGESLARKSSDNKFSDTKNNSEDFLGSLPTPRNSHYSGDGEKELLIYASVSGNNPQITGLSLPYDDSEDEGIQIMPLPGKTRNLTFEASISDSDGADDLYLVSASFNQGYITLTKKETLNATSEVFEGTISLEFYDSPGIYTLVVSATDSSNLSASANLSLEYLPIVAFGLDTSEVHLAGISGQLSEAIGDTDLSTFESPTIRNLGNTELDFGIFATDLDSGSGTIPVENLYFSFFDNDFEAELSGPLGKSAIFNEVNLPASALSLRELSLRLLIPLGTKAGDYEGRIYLQGMVS